MWLVALTVNVAASNRGFKVNPRCSFARLDRQSIGQLGAGAIQSPLAAAVEEHASLLETDAALGWAAAMAADSWLGPDHPTRALNAAACSGCGASR